MGVTIITGGTDLDRQYVALKLARRHALPLFLTFALDADPCRCINPCVYSVVDAADDLASVHQAVVIVDSRTPWLETGRKAFFAALAGTRQRETRFLMLAPSAADFAPSVRSNAGFLGLRVVSLGPWRFAFGALTAPGFKPPVLRRYLFSLPPLPQEWSLA